MSQGWVSLYRKIMDWEWYKDANTCRVFIHLLLKANHKSGAWKGVPLSAGQFITGRKVLAQELDLTEAEIRTALKHLKMSNEITIKTTSQFSIITINKWNEYQQNDQHLTSKEPTKNQRLATNNNVNNVNNENKPNFYSNNQPVGGIYKSPEQTKADLQASFSGERRSPMDDYETAVQWLDSLSEESLKLATIKKRADEVRAKWNL
jgi:hypothetical protein